MVVRGQESQNIVENPSSVMDFRHDDECMNTAAMTDAWQPERGPRLKSLRDSTAVAVDV